MEFLIGDVVELNSGGPPMVIFGMANSPDTGLHVLVEWDADEEKMTDTFPACSVHRIGVEQIKL